MKIDNSWINCTKQTSSSTFDDQFYIGDFYGSGYPTLGLHKKVDGVDYWATLNGESLYVRDATFSRNCVVSGNLTVYGSKNRVVKTKSYGTRGLNAYETADCYFGDIGEGQLDDNGICTINLSPIFLETVNTKLPYQVFLQAYGDGKCWVSERNENNFVVKGTPNMPFGYEIKAKQLGYENNRLEEIELPR